MQGGLTVPGYTLVRRLDDTGAQATVHLGRSTRAPHREAAIKIYHASLRTTRDRQRFQREVEALERLADDPHIIDVYESGVLDNGQAYLAMKLCSGGSLASLLNERGPMSPAAVVSLGVTLAETLGRAHRLGVLHRDVKPHNILLGDDGAPVLADFGIVALQNQDLAMTATGRWTAAYAAPELFHDQPASVRSDVYGLAATLYTLLGGRPPHHDRGRAPSPAELVFRRNSEPELIEGIPEELMSVLLQALAPEPQARHATAGAFAAALREAVPAPPPFDPAPFDPAVVRPGRTGRHAAEPDDGAPASHDLDDLLDLTGAQPGLPPVSPMSRAKVALTLPGVDPARPVSIGPSVQPGLLATALVGVILVALLGLGLAAPIWMLWWTGLTLAVAAISAWAGRLPGLLTFIASLIVVLTVSVRTYEENPLGSLGWALIACLTGVTAWAWGQSSSALRLRWFAWRQAVQRRRWWGQASVRSELTSVETLPAARFLRLAEGTCHYGVACGSAVALVRWASWSSGRYLVMDAEVRRDGVAWPQGASELTRARRGLSLLNHSGVDASVRRRVFLAVDTPGELRRRELSGDLTVVPAHELAEALGGWLSTDPYTLDLELLSVLIPLAESAD